MQNLFLTYEKRRPLRKLLFQPPKMWWMYSPILFLMAGATALGIAQGALVAGEQPKFPHGWYDWGWWNTSTG